MKNIFIIANTSWYIYNFRLSLIEKLQGSGYKVTVIAPFDDYSIKLENNGAYFLPISLNRKGLNPFLDLMVIVKLLFTFKSEKPDLVLTYTPKINIYASIAAHLLGIPVINNISGLGTAFIRKNIITLISTVLYKSALSKSKKVFFQNNDDLKYFTDHKIVSNALAERIPGSGVDVDKFRPVDTKCNNGNFVFLLVARMLWDKGIGELIDAMKILKPEYPYIECQLLGFLDQGNPSAIPGETLMQWEQEGVSKYLGSTDNVLEYMINADCIVLPSYREGVPRCLLEGASLAKPIITTDAVGCRDVVNDGVNGFLCRIKDSIDLADKMKKMINMSAEEIGTMGSNGRKKMVAEFDEQTVIDRYMNQIGKYCN